MKTLFAAASVLAVLASTPAMADDKADVSITGNIALACTVSPDVRDVTVDLNSTAAQSAGSLTYRCNGANGFTRTIASDNAGQLNNVAGANKGFVPYTITHGGGSGLGIATPVSLATPTTTNLGSSAAFVNGQTGTLSLILAKPASASAANPLFAGDYTDVIRVSITAN
ncbi:hypothetical protein [Sphingopyxis sp. C-1]|uniref:hypothetical protein n=1 Tax=Sphingopyxis sp. C-1 TaxID=262667 RepID=UPI0006C3F8E0|nr:hypothetical protein [Sphingopyxis sp. C-1]GAO80923.1 hypothetical protein SC1_04249 [Sphingopyxis sp. C-1]